MQKLIVLTSCGQFVNYSLFIKFCIECMMLFEQLMTLLKTLVWML